MYTFCEAMGPVDIPVTPVPVAESIRETSNHDNIRLVELLGEDFSPELTVWFGDVPAVTTAYRYTYTQSNSAVLLLRFIAWTITTICPVRCYCLWLKVALIKQVCIQCAVLTKKYDRPHIKLLTTSHQAGTCTEEHFVLKYLLINFTWHCNWGVL